MSVDTESNPFKIHWYSNKPGSKKVFIALDLKDKDSISEQSLESVMFWGFTDEREEKSFSISTVMLDTIRLEYENLDK